jgi:hypothetical protein
MQRRGSERKCREEAVKENAEKSQHYIYIFLWSETCIEMFVHKIELSYVQWNRTVLLACTCIFFCDLKHVYLESAATPVRRMNEISSSIS